MSQVTIGRITAHCPLCGAKDFAPAMQPADEHRESFICVACRTETFRRVLIDQIGQEAMRRANDALKKSRASRR